MITCFLASMLFNKILCNFCFHYLTTSPTCSEAGGAGDLVSQLIYLRKSSCVVPSRRKGKAYMEAYLRKAYIEFIITNFFLQGGSDPCLNSDKISVHPRF